VPLSFADGYAITKKALESAVSERTRILIVNTPNNPTGRVMTQQEADIIAAFAQKYDLMVIADEIYEKIRFDGSRHISLGSIPEIADRVVTINGLSKCSAMTGWRLGYLTANQKVVDQIYLFYQHVFTCVAEFAQEAAVAALDDPQSVETMRLSYQQRRDSFIADLETLPGIRCIVPEGAFYAWARIDYQGMDADAMAKFLLEQAHVVTVPGGAYGENSRDCVRMCFAADPKDLKEAVQRMAAVLKED
jgi:aspartate aminotransferase